MTFIPTYRCVEWNLWRAPLWQRILSRVTLGAYLPPQPERCGVCLGCEATEFWRDKPGLWKELDAAMEIYDDVD